MHEKLNTEFICSIHDKCQGVVWNTLLIVICNAIVFFRFQFGEKVAQAFDAQRYVEKRKVASDFVY